MTDTILLNILILGALFVMACAWINMKRHGLFGELYVKCPRCKDVRAEHGSVDSTTARICSKCYAYDNVSVLVSPVYIGKGWKSLLGTIVARV